MSQRGIESHRVQRGNVTFQAGSGRWRRAAPNDSAGRRGYPADNAKVANTETPTLARCGARRAANVITTCGRMPGSTRRPHEQQCSHVTTPLMAKSKMWKLRNPPRAARSAYVSFSG